MAHVTTGCRDCKACTNSGVANAGRGAGRTAAAIMTVGMSEAARGFTKNCSICGHKLSLHQSTDYVQPSGYWVNPQAQVQPQQPIVIIQQVPAPYPPQQHYPPQQVQRPQSPPAWHADPARRHEFRWWDGQRWTEHVSDRGQLSIDPV